MVSRSTCTTLLAAVLVYAAALSGIGCRPPRPPAAGRTPVAPAPAPPPVDTPRLHALLLNGGGSARQNYQSHLLHIRQVHTLLREAGVPEARITVFGSDGEDPGLDLALREAQPEPGFWLLEGTYLEGALRTPITYESSSLAGATIRPATEASLREWFATRGAALQHGDVLLLYVTDHGTRGKNHPTENAITLWGKDERLTVLELSELIAGLPPGVRVVTLMSQCFSGGFADLPALAAERGKPAGAVCGYFSSTADRMAYGCYPENRGKDNVGHSFRFLEAVAERGSFPAAHEAVLVRDTTPDVPLRTSDVHAESMLRLAAEASGSEFEPYVDALLADAWSERARFEHTLRLLDRTSAAFGMFSPRSLAELRAQAGSLPDVRAELDSHKRAWRETLSSATNANLGRFVAAEPAWGARLTSGEVGALTPAEARRLTPELLAALGRATREAGADGRLETLRARGEENAALAYRMAVREAVVLRLRALLIDVAASVYLEKRATPAERADAAALLACETVTVAPAASGVHALSEPERFPPLDDDLALAKATMPGWLGIQFRQAPDQVRERRQLADGAVSVVAVYPNSPASAAGLRTGDVVLGPPATPFEEREQVREWTMLSTLDQPRTLRVLRDGRETDVTITPGARPLRWPSLPGPPKVGAAAPALGLTPYRGTPPMTLAGGASHLLFFWATWCGVCKAALPELDAWERASGTRVVAISDEEPAQLDRFFASHTGPFPALVAIDELRRSFLAYGVSGMPTFVLVAPDGTVRHVKTGYSRTKGLDLPG
jgi:thiol-disulfide isomerase/thioredoxin